MKKFKVLALATLLLAVSSLGIAQTASNVPVTSPAIARQYGTLAATGAQASLYERGYGLGTHILYWSAVSGTNTTCQVKVEKAPDNATWADLIPAQTCTSDGYAIITGSPVNYVRVNVTTLTGAGNTIAVSYKAFHSEVPVIKALCDAEAKFVAVNTAAASTVQNVALVANQSVYICGYHITSTGATNVTIEYGTGASCGTGTTVITGAMTTAAGTDVDDPAAYIKVPAGNALCTVNSAAVQISGYYKYIQH
jgi:hypothetical protein